MNIVYPLKKTWRAFLLAALFPIPVLAQTVGPMVGQVSTDDARFLYRADAAEKTFLLSVLSGSNGLVVATSQATSLAANDYVAKFQATGLLPGTLYEYKLEEIPGGGTTNLVAGSDSDHNFRTLLPNGSRGVVSVAFLSGANADAAPVFEMIDHLGIGQLYLMGDTPYINSSDLAVIRQKHRDFLNMPSVATLMRHTSVVGTWDDHDFGINNSNGATFSGKESTRQGFVEYRAHDQYGTGTEGVYFKVDHGVMEIYMLDPRWFSQTAPSPVDPTQKTSLGTNQWDWIRSELLASKAPFKVLAMGQIWQDKKNSETDDMFTYWYERDALLDFIRDEGIPGVVLFGGDIHVSRHLVHPRRVGYDLHDFISSPAHAGTIASLNVYHPDLEWSLVEPRQFLTLTADTRVQPPVLTARYMLHDGSLQHEVAIPYDQLVPKAGADLGRELRAWWSFDGSYTNQSVLGSRIDAVPENGASLVADGGLSGGAASLDRSSNQYLLIPRSILHDNSAAHTVSLWCKPGTLPAHGGAERQFLLESTGTGTVGSSLNHALSLGLQATDDPAKVNLQLYTYTLKPATGVTTAPTAFAQGPFDTDIDRSLLLGEWTHIAFTFDSQELRLFINGAPVSGFPLPVPGPLCENGGLVIGGHREGAGRNLDGLVDEVALWARVLEDGEMVSLYNGGTPAVLPTTPTIADTDGDSMPDWWEKMNGLNPTHAADALSTSDGDTIPAFVEFQTGGSPLVDNSGFYNALFAVAAPEASAESWVYRNPSTGMISFKVATDQIEDLRSVWSALDLDAPEVSVSTNGNQVIIEFPAGPEADKFFRMKGEG